MAAFQAGASSSSLHDDLGRVHHVKTKPLRGRFCDGRLRNQRSAVDL